MRRGLGLRLAAMLVALACVAGMTACGGDDDGGGGGGDGGGPTTLKVGVIPIADVAPLYLGIDKGFFEEQQLTIQPQLAEGGAAITPGGRERRLPDRLLEHDLAADRRLTGPADPDHHPGRAGRQVGEGGVGGSARSQGRANQGAEGPRGQDDRRQHAQEHLRGHDQGVAGGGGRGGRHAQVRGGALPRHERRARGGPGRRGLRGRALRQPGQGRQGARDRPLLREDRTRPHRRHLFHLDPVRRGGPRRRGPAS